MPTPFERLKEGAKKTKEKIEAFDRKIRERFHESALYTFGRPIGREKGSEPKFWGSWKGRVARAIVEYGPLSWGQLRDITGLSKDTLNKVLSEMYDALAIERREDGTYWLSYELYKEYQEFLRIAPEEILSDRPNIEEDQSAVVFNEAEQSSILFLESEQEELVTWIDNWKNLENLEFPLEPQHFYLTRRHLDDLSKKIISQARKEVMVVNPFVQQCDLSNTIREVADAGKTVLLITRPAGLEKNESYRKAMKNYHQSLRKAGVYLVENKTVHAKIIVVDRRVAIVSSMNFYATSSGGQSWEAGLVTVNQSVVENVADSVMKLSEAYESHIST